MAQILFDSLLKRLKTKAKTEPRPFLAFPLVQAWMMLCASFSFLAGKATSTALGREGIWEKAGYKTLIRVPLVASDLKLKGATQNPLLERDGEGAWHEKNNGQIPMPRCWRVLQVCTVQCIGNEVETWHVCREHGSEVTSADPAWGTEAGCFASKHSLVYLSRRQ